MKVNISIRKEGEKLFATITDENRSHYYTLQKNTLILGSGPVAFEVGDVVTDFEVLDYNSARRERVRMAQQKTWDKFVTLFAHPKQPQQPPIELYQCAIIDASTC
jgi:hypothetical protein